MQKMDLGDTLIQYPRPAGEHRLGRALPEVAVHEVQRCGGPGGQHRRQRRQAHPHPHWCGGREPGTAQPGADSSLRSV